MGTTREALRQYSLLPKTRYGSGFFSGLAMLLGPCAGFNGRFYAEVQGLSFHQDLPLTIIRISLRILCAHGAWLSLLNYQKGSSWLPRSIKKLSAHHFGLVVVMWVVRAGHAKGPTTQVQNPKPDTGLPSTDFTMTMNA